MKETKNPFCYQHGIVLQHYSEITCKTEALHPNEKFAGITSFGYLYAVVAQSAADKFSTFRGEIFFSQDTDCPGQICEMGQRGIIYRMVPFLQLNSLLQHN